MTCFTPWVLGYNINLIPEKFLSPVKELQPYEPIHESYGHMMNALMFYYLYINLSVIFYHTIRSLKLIFIKYFRLCRRQKLGIGEEVYENDELEFGDDKLTQFMRR